MQSSGCLLSGACLLCCSEKGAVSSVRGGAVGVGPRCTGVARPARSGPLDFLVPGVDCVAAALRSVAAGGASFSGASEAGT